MKLTHRLPILLLAACCLLLASPTRAADVVAHWSFDQLTDDARAFPDSTGNRNATISDKSAATLDNGKDVPFGKGVSLGPGGNGLSIPPLPNIYDRSFTVAAWVKLAANSNDYLLSDWAKPNAYAFGFAGGKVICILRNAKITSKGNTSEILAKGLNVPISTGVWHHVAWVWNHTGTKTGNLSVYLDGVKAGEANANGKIAATIANNARPANIGFKADNNTPFRGSVDELWVFNDALSADQVNNLMKSNDINTAGALAIVTPSSPSPTTPTTPTTPTPAASAQITTPTPAQPTPAQPTPQATADNTPPTFVIPNNPAPTPTPTPTTSSPTLATTPTTPSTPTAPVQTTPAPPNFIVTPTNPTITTPPTITPIATITPPHYTPARIAGIIFSGATALMLSGFLFWASQERGKMRQSRR